MEFQSLVSKRRSNREFSGKPLKQSAVEKILKAAVCAPNHKRNQPWRFTVIRAEEIANFWARLAPHASSAMAESSPEEADAKIQKLAAKLPKLGAIIHVTVLADANPQRERENYAAACCAVQNMCLMATDLGLGSFWSTGKIFASEACGRLLGIGAEEKFVGSIWFGHAVDSPEAPGFSLDPVTRYWRA